MTFDVDVDTSKLERMLTDFPVALARAQQRILRDIGQAVASRATLAFRTPQMRPSPWAPRKPSYTVTVNKKTGRKAKKIDDHPLLIKSGSLRQSIGWKLRGGDSVVVGTDKQYAGYHQFGTKHMPARPFMPVDKGGNLTPQMMQKIHRIVEKALAEELGRIGIR